MEKVVQKGEKVVGVCKNWLRKCMPPQHRANDTSPIEFDACGDDFEAPLITPDHNPPAAPPPPPVQVHTLFASSH